MPLDLADGYTLHAKTLPEHRGAKNLPVVEFGYRPALAAAMAAWRHATERAMTPEAEFAADAKLLCDHLVYWNVSEGINPAPITPATLARLPDPILAQIFAAVITWSPRDAAGNS